ncbi:MAG TPA: dihydropteroate synthase [Candidatus Baltobacteraceae bacterium]
MLPPRADRGALRLGGNALDWGQRTYVMGIVNVTPDSFSNDGRVELERAVARGVEQADAGSDVLDLGGESTRPGHERIDDASEIRRVVPAIAALRERLPGVALSIDTYKPQVAREACAAGADLINSVWGMDDALLDVAVEFGTPVVIMHNKARAHYDGDAVDEVLRFLEEAAKRSVRRGIPARHIVLDPGIGFGKTADQNIAVLHALARVVALGFPTMIGASRKSTIGKLTGRPVGERAFGTAATTALAVQAGIDMVRVHDVAQTRDVLAVADAIVRDWRPQGWIE